MFQLILLSIVFIIFFLISETNDQIKEINLPSVVEVLTNYLMHNSIQTKVAVLRWIHDLYIKLPKQVSSFNYQIYQYIHIDFFHLMIFVS